MSDLISTPLGRLAVRHVGNGTRRIVLWPAIFTDRHVFEPILDALSKMARIMILDGPGHGGSEGPARRFTMAACAEALEAVLNQSTIDSAIVGGVSWGGIVACELALRAPERVEAIIAMNTPFAIGSEPASLSSKSIGWAAGHMPAARIFRNGIERSFFTGAGPEHGFHDVLRNAEQGKLGAAVRSVLLSREALMPRLQDVDVPALVIAGENDPLYPLEESAEAALRLPQGHFASVPGKHIAPIEAPRETAAAIAAFMEKLA